MAIASASGWIVRVPRIAGMLAAGKEGDLGIVYEDDVLVVLNKPPGLLSVPLASRGNAASVEDELVEHLRSHGNRRPLVVHRIDRDTSGLVVFAKRGDVQLRLKDQFRRREPERVYLAIVHGHLAPRKGTWRDRIAWDATIAPAETRAPAGSQSGGGRLPGIRCSRSSRRRL